VSRWRSVTDTYDYDAFGNKINSTGTTPNEFLYRGEQFDADLGRVARVPGKRSEFSHK